MCIFRTLWLLALATAIQSGLIMSQTGGDSLKNIDRVANNQVGSLVKEKVTPPLTTRRKPTTTTIPPEFLDLSEPSDTILIFDRSPSVSRNFYNRSTKFAKELIRKSMIVSGNHTRLAVITFAGSVRLQFDHISDSSYVHTSCELFSVTGSWAQLNLAFNSSDIGSKIEKAFDLADDIFTAGKALRKYIKRTIWLLTDAEDFDDSAFVSSETLRTKGIKIYGVGVGGFLNVSKLKKIVSNPVDKYYKTLHEWERFLHTNIQGKNANMTSPILAEISQSFCVSQQYNCGFQTTCHCDVSHSIDVKCTCPSGHFRQNDTCQACPQNTYKIGGGDGPCHPCEPGSQASACKTAPNMWGYLMWIFVALNIALFLVIISVFVFYAVRRWKNRPAPKDTERQNPTPTSNSIYTQTYGPVGPDILADVRYTTESPWSSNTNLIRTHTREDSGGYMEPVSAGAQGRTHYLTTGAKTFSPDGARVLAGKKLMGNHSYVNEGKIQTISDNAIKKKALKLPAFANLRGKFRKNREYENEDVINSLRQNAPAPEQGEDSHSESSSATASRLEYPANRGQGRPLVAKGRNKSKGKKSKKSRKYQNEYIIESLKRNSKIDNSPTEDVQSILNKFEKSPNSGASRSPILRKKNVKRLQDVSGASTSREPSYLSIHPPSEMDFSAAEDPDNETSNTDTAEYVNTPNTEYVNTPTTEYVNTPTAEYGNASTIEKARQNKP